MKLPRVPRVPVAHELNNAVAATIMNAETALRWLERQPPDVERAHEAINRIVADGKRAAVVIGGLRELNKRELVQTKT